MSRRALVIGGSLSGLFAATLLRHAGWDVAVYERSSVPLSGRGAGIVTHPALADALVRAGVTAAELGVAVPGRVVFAPDGDILAQHDAPQVLTSWSRLYALLDAALPAHLVHRGWALDQISQDGSAVVAHFANGEQARGDILIGADGFRSAVRRAVLPTVCPSYAGYIAWRGLADEAALPAATHAALFGRFAFCLPDGEQILGYPIAGDGEDMRPGRRRYNVVWYRPANDATLQDMLTDDSGRTHLDGIPPGSIRQGLVTAMRAAAERVLCPQFADVVRACATPFFQPIYDLAVPHMVHGRVALMGDAAFVARPHAGMGVTKAAQDAVALAAALETGPIAGALQRYEAERRPAGDAVVAKGRLLGAYMQAQCSSPSEQYAAARYRTPQAVITETAWITA